MTLPPQSQLLQMMPGFGKYASKIPVYGSLSLVFSSREILLLSNQNLCKALDASSAWHHEVFNAERHVWSLQNDFPK